MSESSELSGTGKDPRTARGDGRALDELRPVSFERDYTVMAPGSVLVSFGQTKVLCTASVEDRVPPWMRGSGKGWVTAEYSMLPGSTPERASREAAKGKQSGRTQEIQRLIARSLRAVCDLVVLGEAQITVDCDVLQADGGTRTASICGAYVALHDAFSRMQQAGTLRENPLTDSVAAISVGIIDGVPMLDLPYAEDSRAEVDMNVVMTGAGRFVEVQGTAEGMAFSRGELDSLLGVGRSGDQGAFGRAGGRSGRATAAAVSPASPLRLVLASANPDKVAEIAAVLTDALEVELVPRPDDVPDVIEDGDDTARQRPPQGAGAGRGHRACAAVADDTGSGGRRARRCPRRVLGPLRRRGRDLCRQRGQAAHRAGALGPSGGGAHRPLPHRGPGFVPRRHRTLGRGRRWRGRSPTEPVGTGGFGYDPVFVPSEGDGRTFADMTPSEKHAISHRGRAFRALVSALAARSPLK